jgi:hypothetical protein
MENENTEVVPESTPVSEVEKPAEGSEAGAGASEGENNNG